MKDLKLFNYQRNNFSPEKFSDADYNELFTKEAAKYCSFQELEKNIDEKLLPALTKWADHIALDRNKLSTLFLNEKVDN